MNDSKITPPAPSCFGSFPFLSFQQQAENCCNDCITLAMCKVRTPQAHATTNQGQVGGDHYRNAEITPWDVWDTWPLEQRIGAYRSNAVKYLMRMGTKDDRLQEAKKALHYVQKLIEVLKNEQI